MSSFFGILRRDGRPVDKQRAASLLAACCDWEPDHHALWIDGPVALGHAQLWNTPQSLQERFPLERSPLVLVMDGRLDGRGELASALGISADRLPDLGDGELLLAAYRKWGRECPRHLLGDFAFLVWDSAARQLFCARDHLGVRPLYFSERGGYLLVGTDLRAILAHPAVSRRVDEDAVANFLVNWGLESADSTFFADIRKLPAGHTLTVGKGGPEQVCYWRPEDSPRVRFRDHRDYAIRLRELLGLAVEDRLRTAFPVSAHLSGGIDSSSVAVLAARRLRARGERLLGFNWLHRPSEADDPSHREWSASRRIAERESISHRYVPLDADRILAELQHRSIAHGDTTLFWYEYPLREAVRQSGSRTILTGWGGDELASYHGRACYTDLLLQGRLQTLLRALWEQAGTGAPQRRLSRMLALCYDRVLLPLAPRGLYCHLPRSRCGEQPAMPLVRTSFMPAVSRFLARGGASDCRPQLTVRAHMLASLDSGHLQSRIESWATAARGQRLEYVYPLLDRRVVEFVLGIPGSCFIGSGRGRFLFRTAVADLLPEDLLWEDAKQELNRVRRLMAVTGAAYRRLGARIDAGRSTSPYVDPDALRLATTGGGFAGDRDAGDHLMDLETAMALAACGELGGRLVLSPPAQEGSPTVTRDDVAKLGTS